MPAILPGSRAVRRPTPARLLSYRRRQLALRAALAALLLASGGVVTSGSAQALGDTTVPRSVSGATCLTDTIAPRITSLLLSAPAVDVTTAAATVTVSVDVADYAPAGVTLAGLYRVRADLDQGPGKSAVVSLRPSSAGVWSGSFAVPAGARPGIWQITALRAMDRAHNSVSYGLWEPGGWWTPPTMPADWPKTVQVIDSHPDVVRPTLRSASFGPRTLDTRHRPGVVHFRLVTGDDRGATSAGMVLTTRADRESQRRFHSTTTQHVGDVFTGRIEVPRWVGQGVSTFTASVWIEDATHYRWVGPKALARRGWPSSVQVRSQARPQVAQALVKVDFGAPVATAAGGARVPVRAVVDGDGVAVQWVSALLWHTPDPSHAHWADLTLAKGTRREGTWRGRIAVPACSSPGDFKPDIWLRSASGTLADYFGYPVVHRGAPVSIPIPWLPGDDRPPRAHTTWVDSSRMAVTFDEGVRDVLPALSLYDGYAGTPLPTSSVTCSTATGETTSCSGGDSRVRRVEFVLAQPMTEQTRPVFVLNLAMPLPQITDAAGNAVQME